MVSEPDPQRLLVTADLHFGAYPQGDACVLDLADFVCSSAADVIILAGDVGDGNEGRFRACLDLFGSFGGPKLVVPGNHDVWTGPAGSEEKRRKILPAIASECGFAMLDSGPVTAGGVGFIGNIGWYDYSFRSPDLNVKIEQYEQKELPGVCVWNDGRFIDWPHSDGTFTEKCLRKLHRDYRAVERRVDVVVAVLHHLPFRELLYEAADTAGAFCLAYMGAECLGQLLLDCPKVRYVFCGHRHTADACQRDHIEAFVVGSEYLLKRMIELDLRSGKRQAHVFKVPRQ